MKIIKEGKITAPWWVGKSYTCLSCGCHWKLEEGDDELVSVERSQQGTCAWSHCPTCRRAVGLVKQIPNSGDPF